MQKLSLTQILGHESTRILVSILKQILAVCRFSLQTDIYFLMPAAVVFLGVERAFCLRWFGEKHLYKLGMRLLPDKHATAVYIISQSSM